MIKINVLRDYLNNLEDIMELLSDLPCIDNKADDFYYNIFEQVETEYNRVYKILKRNEEKTIEKLIDK